MLESQAAASVFREYSQHPSECSKDAIDSATYMMTMMMRFEFHMMMIMNMAMMTMAMMPMMTQTPFLNANQITLLATWLLCRRPSEEETSPLSKFLSCDR